MDGGYGASTLAIHADSAFDQCTDIAPAMRVSTTFRNVAHSATPATNAASDLMTSNEDTPISQHDRFVYSRIKAPNTTRLEMVLTSLLEGPTVVYASGLAAFYALLVHTQPRVVAITAGYHGSHDTLSLYQRTSGCRILHLENADPQTIDEAELGDKCLLHVESPNNPTGEAQDIVRWVRLARGCGALVSVDATFGPPPLQYPFDLGVDYVLHSGTKYFGGHSDMLCGVLAVSKRSRSEKEWTAAYDQLQRDRQLLGAVTGSLEGWLGLRSLRTLSIRVMRQSESASTIVSWIAAALTVTSAEADEEQSLIRRVVGKISHSSLQRSSMLWLAKQMPHGDTPVFSIRLRSDRYASVLLSALCLFHHASSLGGVESLVDFCRIDESSVDRTQLRISVGLEDVLDLKSDLLKGFRAALAVKIGA